MTLSLLGTNAALVLALMTALWVVSIALRDVSIVDPWWSIGFLVVSAHTAYAVGITPAKLLLLAIVAVWAVRLWIHLLLRSRGKPEDPRYQAFRRHFGAERYWWFSLFQVFLLQGVLVLVISAPLVVAGSARAPDPIGVPHLVGLALFVVGFVVEAVADAQLNAFRGDPQRRGGVLDTGLWRWSRHPNYFGEALLGWGFWFFALGQPFGWATVFAPALMTFLLLRVSGVTMLDAHMTKTKPGYADYVRRTSAFVPWPPAER
jgi:steroid 5-alpha reductase family enzyme